MPGPIKRYKTKPKGMSAKKWKGPGEYYKRSGDAGWSKRNKKLDGKRKAKKYKGSKTSSTGSGPYSHLHDQTITKKEYINYKTGKVVKSTTKKTTSNVKKPKRTTKRKAPKRKTTKRKAPKRKTTKRKAPKRKTTKRKGRKRS